jgi:hypothetical protein
MAATAEIWLQLLLEYLLHFLQRLLLLNYKSVQKLAGKLLLLRVWKNLMLLQLVNAVAKHATAAAVPNLAAAMAPALITSNIRYCCCCC